MIYTLFIAGSAFLVISGLVAAWSRRNRWARWLMVGFMALVIPTIYFASIDLLSRPKPYTHEFLLYHTKMAQVVGLKAIAGQGLYLMLYSDKWSTPRHYSYPWNEQTKEMIRQVQEGWEKSQATGEPLFMFFPFEPSLNEDAPIFKHPIPQLAPPPKDTGIVRPKEYEV